MRRPTIAFATIVAGLNLLLLAPLIANWMWPLPLDKVGRDDSRVILAADGSVLRTFADRQGVRRFRIGVDDVSPNYVQALLHYEDRYFYQHLGVNPVALLRAVGQRLAYGRWISGGSTISMQVARILDPHSRSALGKLKQIFRTAQLEAHFSKSEILGLYLNYAPFGGNVEGVEAAARRYLGKSSLSLSHGEAALLAVLPQSPSRNRPDRFPERAIRARNKVLSRLEGAGIWSADDIRAALVEEASFHAVSEPLHAPLLAERVADGSSAHVIKTTIDPELQVRLQYAAARYVRRHGAATSAAILVVDHEELSVQAYIGTARYGDTSSQGYVDMVQAIRSPGSLLKPLIYGLALEYGYIDSTTALFDVPRDFDGYRPQNFSGDFTGMVAADEALRRSLNVPAVDLLDRIGPERFAARLRSAGVELEIPEGRPSLALALGGFGIRLDQLVMVYAALARDGQLAPLGYSEGSPKRSGRRLLDSGAAWIVQEMLREPPLAGQLPSEWAVKTGTSYGHRDAWAIGNGPGFTVGVWVGRPDGTPVRGQFGAATAVPLLNLVTEMLPRDPASNRQPWNVVTTGVCWPMPEDCAAQRLALTINGVTPRVVAPMHDSVPAFQRTAIRMMDGLHLTDGCLPGLGQKRGYVEYASWLGALTRGQPKQALPAIDPRCAPGRQELVIMGIRSGTTIVARDARIPVLTLEAVPPVAAQWSVNGKVLGAGASIEIIPAPGTNRVSALFGQSSASLRFDVVLP